MHTALKRLAALPEETFVFAAHEYTQANLRFASEADPDNEDVKHALTECDKARA